MNNDRELMQQALEALEEGLTSKEWRELIAALRERLAQPEQSPLDRMAENARELGLDYEPVQKEKPDGLQTTGPLTDRTDHVRNGGDYTPEPDTKVNFEAIPEQISEPEQEPVAWQWLDTGTFRKSLPASAEPGAWRPLYTTPPRREWVGLTKEEAKEISLANRPYVVDMIAALEARLKEKNNG